MHRRSDGRIGRQNTERPHAWQHLPGRPRIRVRRKESRSDRGNHSSISDVASKHRRTVDSANGRNHTDRGKPANRRLQSDDSAHRGRHTTRPGRVGTQGKRHDPSGDAHSGTGTRSTRHQRGIQRVARGAVGRTSPDQSSRKLIEVGLADRNRAGSPKTTHYRRVGNSGIGRKPRTTTRRHRTANVDVVLHQKRHAMQREPGYGQQIDRPCSLKCDVERRAANQ